MTRLVMELAAVLHREDLVFDSSTAAISCSDRWPSVRHSVAGPHVKVSSTLLLALLYALIWMWYADDSISLGNSELLHINNGLISLLALIDL